jgi:hypothetical protein
MRTHRVTVIVSGAAATALLHGLVLIPVIFAAHYGGSAKRTGAASLPMEAEPIQFVGWVTDAQRSPVPTSAATQLSPVPIQIADATALLPDSAIETENTSAGAGGSSDQARPPAPLYVQHMSQITERIQSQWTVPSPLPADFHCRVLIRRAPESTPEVEIEQCDADPSLRGSLLQAIDRAAPLPPLEVGGRGPGDIRLEFAAFAASAGGRRTSVEPGAAGR